MKTISPYATTDPPKKESVFFSWKFWLLLYGLKTAVVISLWKPMVSFLTAKVPWVVPVMKVCWLKASTLFVASWKLFAEAFLQSN